MSLKFNLAYNTPSDWTKAITTALGAAVAAYGTANLDGAVTGPEWFGVLGAAVVGFITALGFYSAKDVSEAPTNLDASVEGEVPSDVPDVIESSPEG